MANAVYEKAKEKFLSGTLDLTTADIKAVAVDSGAHTPNLTTNEFLSDIAGGARIATSPNLASKTVTAGVFDAADVEFTAFSGVQFEYIALYKDTGVAATSPLIALLDTATGLPFTPSGGPLIVRWDNGASKIFAL